MPSLPRPRVSRFVRAMMTSDPWDARILRTGADELWSPGQRTRFWLPLGIGALLVDLSLGIVATWLELAHWGKEGLTPDVIVSYVALVPQTLIVATYLILARDAGARSLYKSMAGLFASYLLISLLSLVVLKVLAEGWNAAIMIAAAAGIIGLAIFSFSKWPKFADQQAESGDEANPPQPADESGGNSWWIHIAIVVALLLAKRFVRKANNFLPNLGMGLSDWAILELLVLVVFALVYAGWFAAAKIRHRDKLGPLAAVLGGTEIAILLIHGALLALVVYAIASAAAANPQLDEDDIDKLLDAWRKRGTVVSAGCHGVWTVLTAFFFASLWMRPEKDWRAEFLNPQATH